MGRGHRPERRPFEAGPDHAVLVKLALTLSASAAGVSPKNRLNSRLNCEALWYPTKRAARAAVSPSWTINNRALWKRIDFKYCNGGDRSPP